MHTNMELRQGLTNNGLQIIRNNQNAAMGNCASILLVANTQSISSSPMIFPSVNTYASPHDNSDLKVNFLKYYRALVSLFSPAVTY